MGFLLLRFFYAFNWCVIGQLLECLMSLLTTKLFIESFLVPFAFTCSLKIWLLILLGGAAIESGETFIYRKICLSSSGWNQSLIFDSIVQILGPVGSCIRSVSSLRTLLSFETAVWPGDIPEVDYLDDPHRRACGLLASAHTVRS